MPCHASRARRDSFRGPDGSCSVGGKGATQQIILRGCRKLCKQREILDLFTTGKCTVLIQLCAVNHYGPVRYPGWTTNSPVWRVLASPNLDQPANCTSHRHLSAAEVVRCTGSSEGRALIGLLAERGIARLQLRLILHPLGSCTAKTSCFLAPGHSSQLYPFRPPPLPRNSPTQECPVPQFAPCISGSPQ